jgi:hypothetical protein
MDENKGNMCGQYCLSGETCEIIPAMVKKTTLCKEVHKDQDASECYNKEENFENKYCLTGNLN